MRQRFASTTRRRFLHRGTGAALCAGAVLGAPHVWAKKRFRLRVLGTHVTLQEPLRLQAQQDLGIELVFSPGGSARVLHLASTRPESFDLYEQWSNSLGILWQAKAIRPIERAKIERWADINNLPKTGRLSDDANLGAGDVPANLLYVQPNGSLGPTETGHVSFLPYVHNVDSFGYNANVVKRGVPYETESWGWLLDEKLRCKVALVNAPTIGSFDAALAAQAQGLMSFGNIGAMTRPEIDKLFSILLDFKRKGQFRGVWSSVPQSVEFMRSGDVVIESMFSPAVAALNGQRDGVPSPVDCVYAAPREGYRAWHGVMCLSSKVSRAAESAAYAYMNWWLSGWPGAFIARQGYYISTPHLSRPHLSDDEWRYWYAGEATAAPLQNTRGEVSIAAGARRNGGSYENRFSRVAVWNTVMNHYEYTLERWNEFLLTGN